MVRAHPGRPATAPVASQVAGLPERISHIVRAWAEKAPDRPALQDGDATWSYRDLAQAVAEARGWLAASRVRPGDRLMIVGENGRAMVALLLACAEFDVWAVPMSAQLPVREIARVRAHCVPRRAVYTVGISRQARQHAEADGAVEQSVGDLGRVALGPLSGVGRPEPVEADGARQVAAILHTSGATGNPKAVMLTHANLLTAGRAANALWAVRPEDRIYAVLPISCAAGLAAVVLGALTGGATLITAPRFDPATTLAALRSGGITMMHGVPSMFALLADYAAQHGVVSVPTALRELSVSGASLDAASKRAAERLLGVTLRQGYGATECGPVIAMTQPGAPADALSAGRIIPEIEIRLITADGRPAPEGEVGELQVRGPTVMTRYYGDDEATAAATYAEGWFDTGDLARLQDGELFVLGREDELIVRNGGTVQPSVVEAVLNAHPKILLSAVIGRGDAEDRALVAFVQSASGASLSAEELADYASRHLPPHQRPSRIVIVPQFPLSPAGIILKRSLAELPAEAEPEDAPGR
jgi:acyl-CoA synthetase (AMP-forming)/AMP-acid ligase II